METTFIYTLENPETHEIRYIGKTNKINKRLNQHLYEASSKRRSYKNSWIKSLKKEGIVPVINIIDD